MLMVKMIPQILRLISHVKYLDTAYKRILCSGKNGEFGKLEAICHFLLAIYVVHIMICGNLFKLDTHKPTFYSPFGSDYIALLLIFHPSQIFPRTEHHIMCIRNTIDDC